MIPAPTAAFARAALAPERRCVVLLLALCIVIAAASGGTHGPLSQNTAFSLFYLSNAETRSPEHGFVGFGHQSLNSDGDRVYSLYNRFPIGGYLIIKAALLAFHGDMPAQVRAARVLMWAFFTGAMLAAYFALKRLTASPSVALAATLLGFSSFYALDHADMIATEGVMDLFAVLLTFHALVLFTQEGRYGQLLAKTCAALLIGWHVFALLLPFIVLGVAAEWRRGDGSLLRRAGRLLRSRHVALGAVALAFGLSMLTLNFGLEWAALHRQPPLAEQVEQEQQETSLATLPSFRKALKRTGWFPQSWRHQLWTANRFLDHVGRASIPYVAEGVIRTVLDFSVSAARGEDKADLFGHIVEQDAQLASGRPTSSIWYVRAELPEAREEEELHSFLVTAVRILGLLVCVATLLAIAVAPHRVLLATLATSCFCWRLLAPGAGDSVEGMFCVGIPLVLYSCALTQVQRWSKTAMNGCVGVALLIFSLSALVSLGPSERVDVVSELASDKEAIHGVAPQQSIVVSPTDSVANAFLLTGRVLLHPSNDEHRHRADFVLSNCIVGDEGLLTPDNRHFYLYDRATYDALYAALDDARLRRSCPRKQNRPLPRTESALDATSPKAAIPW